MIRSFKDPEAEALFSGKFSRRLQKVARVWHDGDADDVEIVDYH